jgi:hypothetical protein
MVLNNIRTPFDVFVSNLRTDWKTHKEYGKDYTFEAFYGLLITDKHRLLEEGKIDGKHQAHFLKGKRKMDPRDRVQLDSST